MCDYPLLVSYSKYVKNNPASARLVRFPATQATTLLLFLTYDSDIGGSAQKGVSKTTSEYPAAQKCSFHIE